MNSGELPKGYFELSGVLLGWEANRAPEFSGVRRVPRDDAVRSFNDLSDVVLVRRFEPLLGSGKGLRKVKLARAESSSSKPPLNEFWASS
jgi:hypothetical protein